MTTSNSNNNKDGHAYYDAIIIGAGISGVSAAYYLQKINPHLRYRILESRQAMGGTWDLFQYPGIRSDSDMYTFGFSFRPWRSKQELIIADKADIMEYFMDTVHEYGIEKHVDFGRTVQAAAWDSHEANWTITTTTTQQPGDKQAEIIYKAKYAFMCTGYYSYDEGYTPEYVNRQAFQGPFIHPQKWPQDLDYTNKKIVVIGSGATAVTLIPSLMKGPNAASHVTMLQRSPTFMTMRPAKMVLLPRMIAKYFGHAATRWYYVLFSMFFYSLCKVFPDGMTKFFIGTVEKLIGSDKFHKEDWTPRYHPWDQRVCLCPDGDFFNTIREGKADVVTDHIVELTKEGVKTEKHGVLPADIIVSATGLKVKFLGGMNFTVDGKPVVMENKFVYKGFMTNGVPNGFVAFGYTNASWTLKVDLTMSAACNLIKLVETKGYRYCQPELPLPENEMEQMPLFDLTSTYIQRVIDKLPKQSTSYPWRLYQNYLYDKFCLQYASLEDKTMKFYK